MSQESQLSHDSQLDDGQLDLLELSSKPTSTVNATKWGVRKLSQWLAKRRRSCEQRGFVRLPGCTFNNCTINLNMSDRSKQIMCICNIVWLNIEIYYVSINSWITQVVSVMRGYWYGQWNLTLIIIVIMWFLWGINRFLKARRWYIIGPILSLMHEAFDIVINAL